MNPQKLLGAITGLFGVRPDRESLLHRYRAEIVDASLDEETRLEAAEELANLNNYYCDTAILPLVLGDGGSFQWKCDLAAIVLDDLIEAGVPEADIRCRFAAADADVLKYVDVYFANQR